LKFLITLILITGLVICFNTKQAKADTTLTKFQISDFINKANALIKGDIVKAERKFKAGKGFWEIKMIAEDGGEVRFDFDLKTCELIEAESSEGPFNYNLNPFFSNVDLQTAKLKTENELGMKIMKWEFKPVKEKWEWRFWYLSKTGVPQLRVDADSGEFITSGKK